MSFTAANRARNNKRNSSGTTRRARRVDPPHTAAGGIGTMVPIEIIAVVENDRQTFDAAELQRLEGSIARHGVLQPLLVTPDGEGYRLIAGERRLRAAKAAKLTEVPVIVSRGDGTFGDISAEMIAWQRFEENAARVDLTPIETAIAYRGLLEYSTQKELAKRLGITQGQVSNTVRLLELPEIWQQWIARGRIAPTAARILLPYATKRPQVLQWLVDRHATSIDDGGFELTESTVTAAVEACTRPMRREQYHDWRAPKKTDCWFSVTPKTTARIKDLDVEELTLRSYGGPEKRAWNIALWTELNEQPYKAAKKKYDAAVKKREENSGATRPKNKADKTPQPFDALKLGDALCRFVLSALADRVGTKEFRPYQPLLLVFIMSTESGAEFPGSLAGDDKRRWPDDEALVDMLAAVPVKQAGVWLADKLQFHLRWESGTQWPSHGLNSPPTLLRLCRDVLQFDPLAAWTPDAQTLATCEEWYLRQVGAKGLNIPHDEQPSTAEELHDWLEQDWPPGHIPAEIHALFKADG